MTQRQRYAGAGLSAALVALLALGACEKSANEPSPTTGQMTVPGVNTTMAVTFYAFTDADGGSREVVSSGTFAFDKSGLELEQFDAQWKLTTPDQPRSPEAASFTSGQPVSKDCLALLSGSGVLRGTTTDADWSLAGEWSLHLPPDVDDNNIVIMLDSVTGDAWRGIWFYVSDAGISDPGAFEADKASG